MHLDLRIIAKSPSDPKRKSGAISRRLGGDGPIGLESESGTGMRAIVMSCRTWPGAATIQASDARHSQRQV